MEFLFVNSKVLVRSEEQFSDLIKPIIGTLVDIVSQLNLGPGAVITFSESRYVSKHTAFFDPVLQTITFFVVVGMDPTPKAIAKAVVDSVNPSMINIVEDYTWTD